ncbi:ketopantoate reductase family protein [Methanosphaera sp. WGK6]|uniref:ketopantoate reductase family protein n=1 Tax=Methanosphaera sp. WGK6 TaxID=1561964 RepID=UPI00084C3013|nr:ketopantoate reductase family protein [Methanosphaera sp. WGK6]OED29912.1 2-dehydropantoate 2-reductase [Methanosphaera sp. WGK6]
MNILIIGTGAIGIALGASMISQKANVSFYAREKTAQAIKTEGIQRIGIFNHLKYDSNKFTVYTNYEEIPSNIFDYILITSKTTANNDISRALHENKRILGKNTKIIIFQNGFGNDEPYIQYFDKTRVYCARVITGFTRPQRHISEITVHTQPILIGSLQNQDTQDIEVISEMINKSGIPSKTTKDIDKYLWAKMLYNCTLNPLGAILDVNYGKLTENNYSINIMNKLIDEIFNVITASGYSTLWKTSDDYKKEFYSKLVPDTYNHKPSTLQDIKKKQKTEIDTLNGKIIQLAKQNNVEVPVNEIIYDMIKTIESNFEESE